MIFASLLLAAALPTDRQYMTGHTDRSPDEVAACVEGVFDDAGVGDNTAAEYGRKVDYRFKNLGGAVKEPTMTMEVHTDGTLVLYGFGTWRGNAKPMWKGVAKKCFPEIRDNGELVKPA